MLAKRKIAHYYATKLQHKTIYYFHKIILVQVNRIQKLVSNCSLCCNILIHFFTQHKQSTK
jgi:hypothetical protein